MKKASKLNAVLKEIAEQDSLSLPTMQKINRQYKEGKGDLQTLINKAKANSAKRVYAQDLIVPNNAMLLQLLKHNLNRHKEDVNIDRGTRTKDIKLKRDYYKETLRVVLSES